MYGTLCYCSLFSAVSSLTILVTWGYNTFLIWNLGYFNILHLSYNDSEISRSSYASDSNEIKTLLFIFMIHDIDQMLICVISVI